MHEPLTKSEFVEQKVLPFRDMDWLYLHDVGYIVWRPGTGNNIELLHIRTFETRKGYGRQLFYHMLDRLKHKPPYHSVFGFTRVDNVEAKMFYGALGFELTEVPNIYQTGRCILFSQSWQILNVIRQVYQATHGYGRKNGGE